VNCKAAGASGISNEFFIYGTTTTLINVLHSMMIEIGVIPTGSTHSDSEILGPPQYRVQYLPYLSFVLLLLWREYPEW
jgi:hypothetical protein